MVEICAGGYSLDEVEGSNADAGDGPSDPVGGGGSNDLGNRPFDRVGARRFDHVGVAVHSIAESVGTFELLTGRRAEQPIALPEQGVIVAFVGAVELLEPTGADTPVGRFLAKRGPGLHHLAFSVGDLTAELTFLRRSGVKLIDEAPRRGAHGLVAFVHPSSAGGVLLELVERGPPPRSKG